MKQTVNNPEREDLIRMAAFIDGEGCIGILQHRQPTKRRPGGQMLLKVDTTNTDPRLAEWCKEKFGGITTIATSKNPKHRSVYRWFAHGEHAATILELCLPFFLLKREQAEIGLSFNRTFALTGSPVRFKRVPPMTHDERMRLKNKLTVVKRTGEYGPTAVTA